MNIFNETTRPNELLFYQRDDENDLRLGEIVKRDEPDFDNSEIVILGIPQDEGVQRNKGRKGAKDAPDNIRAFFYRLTANENLSSKKIFDLGDLIIKKTLEETHDMQEEIISQLTYNNKKVVVLGGGNDISYPDCKGLWRSNKNILAINIDSHFDARFDEPRNSGTPYYMLLKEGIIKGENFFEVGAKKFYSSKNHEKYLKDKNVSINFFDEAKQIGIQNLLNKILNENKSDVIFWGFDMDSVRSADAPGVSAPCPIGFTAEEAVATASIAGKEKRSKIFEISEVNPTYDTDGRTCRLAAIMIWNFINNLRS